MGTAISDYTIGSEAIFAPDYIFNATAMPNNDNTSSGFFKFGKNQSGTELIIVADAETVVAATKTLTFELLQDVSETGDYTTSKTLATYPAATYAAGTEFVRFVASDDILQFCKVKVTTTDDLSGKTITGYLRYISR